MSRKADPVPSSDLVDHKVEVPVEKQPEEDASDRESIARLLDDGCPHGREGERHLGPAGGNRPACLFAE
jgi:hypothetical protein